MEVICKSCNAKLNIPDEKVPQGKVVNINCPKCKQKIALDTRSPKPESPDDGSISQAVQTQSEDSPPKAAIEEDDDALGFIEEGIKLSLALGSDPEESEAIKLAIEELGYKYAFAQNTRKAISKMRLHHFDLLILSDHFDGVELKHSPILQYLNSASMSVRRKTFLALIGDDLKTMDNMMAFSLSANMVVNRNDLDNLAAILKRGISDNERFYKVFIDMLVETGKG